MGRNKDLRRRIASCQRVIEEHEDRIRAELTKPHPNEDYIRGWRREIETQKATVSRLIRRLKRVW